MNDEKNIKCLYNIYNRNKTYITKLSKFRRKALI